MAETFPRWDEVSLAGFAHYLHGDIRFEKSPQPFRAYYADQSTVITVCDARGTVIAFGQPTEHGGYCAIPSNPES